MYYISLQFPVLIKLYLYSWYPRNKLKGMYVPKNDAVLHILIEDPVNAFFATPSHKQNAMPLTDHLCRLLLWHVNTNSAHLV
jgi:hypothetical protein